MSVPQPGDLIYMREPNGDSDGNAEVFTDRVWTIVENEGLGTHVDGTYWSVQAACDNRCKELGVSGCYWPYPHSLGLSEDDFVLVSQLPDFTVERS
jgi:hypothetical protein